MPIHEFTWEPEGPSLIRWDEEETGIILDEPILTDLYEYEDYIGIMHQLLAEESGYETIEQQGHP